MSIEDPTKINKDEQVATVLEAKETESALEKRDFSEVLEMFEKSRGTRNFHKMTEDIELLLRCWNDEDEKSWVDGLKSVYPGWEREDFIKLLNALGKDFIDMQAEEDESLQDIARAVPKEKSPEKQRREVEYNISGVESRLSHLRSDAPKVIFDNDRTVLEYKRNQEGKVSWYDYKEATEEQIRNIERFIAKGRKKIEEQQQIIEDAKGFFKGGKRRRAQEEIDLEEKLIRLNEKDIQRLQTKLEVARKEHEKTEVAEKERELLRELEDLKNKQAELKK